MAGFDKSVELLVPAGGERQFIAAVENGADAIYVGGRAFNARINAGNFDDETMQAAIDYAHLRGVKVFVTMNILISDDELEEALGYAAFLYKAGADALIIQDLGFGRLVKEKLPDFEIHLSTQATCCDVDSLEAAHELGYKRVVPARELSLNEIKALCSTGLCDIEIFVHGAMCICYSGQCQLSRYYGGRSGNRGQCAQPCRLPYNGDGVHPLSPKDMCQIDNIGRLIDAGVYSFKIEGRMKSPEYVASVTRIYRKYIDLYLENGDYEVSAEDREALLQIFNRGKFTEAYMDGDPGRDFMSMTVPKNQGIKIGKLVATAAKSSTLVDVELSGDLAMGDGVEIRGGGRAAGNIISYIKPLGKGRFRIGDIRGEVKPGDIVYRTSRKSQLAEARQSFEGRSVLGDDKKPIRKRPVDMVLTGADGMLSLEIGPEARPDDANWPSMQTGTVTVTAEPFEYDSERGASRDRIENALGKLGSTPFALGGLKISGTDGMLVKASELNDLRRRACEALTEAMKFRREDIRYYYNPPYDMGLEEPDEDYYFRLRDYVTERGNGNAQARIAALPLAEICLEAEESGTPYDTICVPGEAIPYISNVPKGRESDIIEKHFSECVRLAAAAGIYAGSLGWLRRFAREGVPVYADFGLNAYNNKTAEVLMELGAAGVVPSLEQRIGGEGCYPLMTSEHSFDRDEYHSRMGHKLRVVKRGYSDQDIFVPAVCDKWQAHGRRFI